VESEQPDELFVDVEVFVLVRINVMISIGVSVLGEDNVSVFISSSVSEGNGYLSRSSDVVVGWDIEIPVLVIVISSINVWDSDVDGGQVVDVKSSGRRSTSKSSGGGIADID